MLKLRNITTGEKILIIIVLIEVISLLLYLLSRLNPWAVVVISILLLISLLIYLNGKEFYSKYVLAIFMVLGLIYLFLPFKIIMSTDQSGSFRVVEIFYGLPSQEGWKKIEQGEYYPGGDITSLFDPKYAIIIPKTL